MKKQPKPVRAVLGEGTSIAAITLPKELNDAILAIAKKAYLDRSSMIRVLLSEAIEARKGK